MCSEAITVGVEDIVFVWRVADIYLWRTWRILSVLFLEDLRGYLCISGGRQCILSVVDNDLTFEASPS